MANFGLISIVVFAAVIAISTHEAFALQCWQCTSFFPHCNETFDPKASQIGISIEKIYLTECKAEETKCLKMVSPIFQNPTTTRKCATPEFVDLVCKDRQKFCEACDSDKCNGASQYGPIAMLIAIPMAIARFSLH